MVDIYDIMLKIPGAFRLYVFLRNIIYTKRPPRTYDFIPLKSGDVLSKKPKIVKQEDHHGIRFQYGSELPISSLKDRGTLHGDAPDISSVVEGDVLDLRIGNERLGIRYNEKNSEWARIDFSHNFKFAFGLAEKHGSLNKFGKQYKIWNMDVADMEPRDDPLYKNYPVLILKGREIWVALIVDFPGFQNWDLRDKRTINIHVKSDQFVLDLITANDPKSLMSKLSVVLGKMELPPLWTLGYHQCRWTYFPADRVRQIAEGFRSRDIPIDALYLDIDYMDKFKVFTYDDENYGDVPKLIDDLHDKNIKVVTMIDPGIKKEDNYFVYDQGKAGDHFVKKKNGEEYHGTVWPGRSVFPDFINSNARDWWGTLYQDFLDMGVDGFWNDMNEPSVFTMRGTMPDDLVHTMDDGEKLYHEEVHNLYGQMMVKASYEGLKKLQPNKRVFLLSRSGYLGSQQYGWIWSGDNRSAWSHLQESIPKIIGTGLAGHFANGPDIGGFREEATPELYARWIQLGVFYPFMRTHYIKFTEKQEPWSFGKDVEEISRSMIKLRYKLAPYIYTYFREGCIDGIPLMRPMWMEFPNAEMCYDERFTNQQFMFGPSLLIAPVVEKGARSKTVYLPEGTWYQFSTNHNYQGEKIHTVDAPLDHINIFVREKSIIPVYKEVGDNMEETRKSGLEFLDFGSNAEGQVYIDDGLTFDYTEDKYGLYKITEDHELELIEGNGYTT